MAQSLAPHNPSSSRPFPCTSRARVALPRQSVRISTLARRNPALLARAMQSPGVDGAAQTKGEPTGPNSNGVTPNKSSGSALPLPFVPVWARWLLGSMVCLAVPLYRRVLRIEDKAGKAAETAAEAVEKVAAATEKIAADLAEALPADGKLKEAAEKIEHVAEVVDKDAEATEAFIQKVEKIEEEVETLVEPLIKQGELVENENQEGQQEEKQLPKA